MRRRQQQLTARVWFGGVEKDFDVKDFVCFKIKRKDFEAELSKERRLRD